MGNIFVSSENSKTSRTHRLLLSLLKGTDEYITLSNLRIYYTSKNIKKPYKKE